MSCGAGALKVEGPVAQKGSNVLKVTMATKPAPTTGHRRTERVQCILTTTHTYLFGDGKSRSGNQQISQVVNYNDPERSAEQSKAELRYASTFKPCRPGGHPARACLPGAQPLTL